MHPAIPTPKLTADTRLAGWLLVAVAVHALLLLIPSQRGLQSGELVPNLAVSLLRPPLQLRDAPALPLQEVPANPVQARPRSEPTPQQAAVPPPVPEPPAEAPTEQSLPSTAYLLDLAGRREWGLPEEAAPRALGEFVPQPPPPNWRSAMTPDANRFDGMLAPAELEIVDRWLAADGSHHVVITAPDGNTYCGRAEAWNPMNPLFEPIMMFRSCGGGGKRTFDMPPPYRSGGAAGERR